MPRTFTLSERYSASVEQLYAAFADERYWLARLADSGADDTTLQSLTVGPAGIEVSTTQSVRRDKLPALAAQFHPGDLQIARQEIWHPIHDGTGHAEVTGTIVGAPATLSGSAALQPDGGDCELRLTATVHVEIPLVGGKIEKFIGAQLAGLLAAEQRFTTTWLDAERR